MRQREMRLGPSAATAALCAAATLIGACQRAAETPAAPGPNVWATVDGREILRDDVEKAYRNNLNPSGPVPSDEEAVNLKLNIVDELITQDLLQARARAGGLEPSDTDVDKAIAERKGSMTEAAFNQELAQRGMTPDDVRRALRRELAVQKVIDQEITSKAKPTDQDITEYFEKNRAQFNLPEAQYRLAQIVITPVREQQVANRMRDDAVTPEEAQRKAQMLGERLRGGADFSVVAMDYSEDAQSAPRGGDLGFIPVSALNRLPSEFRGAVTRMQPGNVQTLTANGSHTIIMLLAREEAGQRDLSSPSVKDGITEALQQRKQQLLQNAFLNTIRNDAKVVNYLARQVVEAQGKVSASLATPPAPAMLPSPPPAPAKP
jgi:peptidyl-prolyl cis-trans isomerase SurA